MKGKISSLFCYLFVITLLVGCAVTPKIYEKQSGLSNQKEKVKIRLTYSTEDFDGKIDELMIKYNESNTDNILVEVTKIPQDRYDQTLNMKFTSGEGPDVFEIGKEWIYTYVTKYWVADVKKYLDNDFIKRFPEWAFSEVKEISARNSIYALPLNQTTVRLIYNKEIFKDAGLNPEIPPKTLSELRYYAQKISKAGIGRKQYGFALPAGDKRMCFEQLMEAANTASGIYYFNFAEGKYDLTAYKYWLNTIIDMKRDESLFPGESTLTNYTALEQFSEGYIGMMYATEKAAVALREQFPTNFEWGAAMPPVIDASAKGKQKVIPTSYFAVSGKSLKINDSVKVWKHIFSDDFVRQLYKDGYIIPVLSGIKDSTEVRSDIDNYDSFIPGKNEGVYPPTPVMVNDWNRFNIYSTVIMEGSDPVKALEEGSIKLNDELSNKYRDGFKIDSSQQQ